MSVYVTQFYSPCILSPEETSSKGYLKLNSLRNIASLPTILKTIITKFVKCNIFLNLVKKCDKTSCYS